jgi:hypothetical protein
VITEEKISLESTVVAGTQHVACEVGDELVMLSLETGEYFGMNPVAARIWDLVQAETTVWAVRDQLLRDYEDITMERCTEDLLDVLAQMRDWRLVEVRK